MSECDLEFEFIDVMPYIIIILPSSRVPFV